MKEYVLTISGSGKIEGIQGIALMQYEHRVTRFAINISAFAENYQQDVLCASVTTISGSDRNGGVVGAMPDENGVIYYEPSAADTCKSGSMGIFVTVLFKQGREVRSETGIIKIVATQGIKEETLSLGAQAALAGMCEVRFSSINGGNLQNWGDKTDKRVAKVDFFNNKEKRRWVGYAQLKPQGTSSLAYPKKNFSLSLFEDAEKSVSAEALFVKDWKAQSKYCMKANWIDPTQACNVVSARIARDMMEGYPANAAAPCHGLIDGYPTLAWFDDGCTGLYTMNIPKEAWMFGMDESDVNNIVMCAEDQLTEGAFRAAATEVGWSIEVGGDEPATILTKFNQMVSFVKDTDSEATFRNNFSQHLDLDACLNYYCFAYMTGATDNLGKNMLMTTRDGAVWAPSLYDLDSLFGVQWDGIQLFASDSPCPGAYQCRTSLLWAKIEEYFPAELCERYFALRKGALSLENITRRWNDFVVQIPESLYKYDARRWLGIRRMRRTLEQSKNWVTERAAYCDEVFKEKYDAATGAPSLALSVADFVSNGNNYKDTEQALFAGKWRTATLLARFKPSADGTVFFSDFSERYPDPGYKGLLCRQVEDILQIQISGDTTSMTPAKDTSSTGAVGYKVSEITNENGYIEVGIVKKIDTYYVYINGLRVGTGEIDVPSAITETLLLGAQWDGIGGVFRTGQVDMPVFELWSGCMTQDEIVQRFKEI